MNWKDILEAVETVLVIDWPSKDVPESLVRAGFHVVVRGGPNAYSAYELDNGEIVTRRVDGPPETADLIYSHRPLNELPEIIALAKRLHTSAIWIQSGLSSPGVKDPKGCWMSPEELQNARDLVEPAGLKLITEPYIGDVARGLKR